MADPFQAVQSMIGSVGRWLGTKENEYQAYKRYGPQWREILDEKERQRVYDAAKDAEDIRAVQASTALNVQKLETEKYSTEQERGEAANEMAKFMAKSGGMEPGEHRTELYGLEEGKAYEPLPVGAHPGRKITAEQQAGGHIRSFGTKSEFEMDVVDLEQNRAERKVVSEIEENEAQAGAHKAMQEKREFEMTDEYFKLSEKYKDGNLAVKKDGRTTAHRNALILTKANELALEEYYKSDPDDLPAEIRDVLYEDAPGWFTGLRRRPVLDPFRLESNKINFSDLKRVPFDLLEEAAKAVQQDTDGLETTRDSELAPDSGGGTDDRPDSEKFRAGQGDEFERDVKIESGIRRKKQSGESMTADEEEYLRRLLQNRGNK